MPHLGGKKDVSITEKKISLLNQGFIPKIVGILCVCVCVCVRVHVFYIVFVSGLLVCL